MPIHEEGTIRIDIVRNSNHFTTKYAASEDLNAAQTLSALKNVASELEKKILADTRKNHPVNVREYLSQLKIGDLLW